MVPLIREGNSLRLKLQIFEGATTLCAVDDVSTCNYSTEVQKQLLTNNGTDHSPKLTSHLQTYTEERGNDDNNYTATVADLENRLANDFVGSLWDVREMFHGAHELGSYAKIQNM